MLVKPAPGRMVRWPNTMRPLSEKGEDVPNDLYWQRLVHIGDVILVTQQVVAVASETKKIVTTIGKKENKDG